MKVECRTSAIKSGDGMVAAEVSSEKWVAVRVKKKSSDAVWGKSKLRKSPLSVVVYTRCEAIAKARINKSFIFSRSARFALAAAIFLSFAEKREQKWKSELSELVALLYCHSWLICSTRSNRPDTSKWRNFCIGCIGLFVWLAFLCSRRERVYPLAFCTKCEKRGEKIKEKTTG